MADSVARQLSFLLPVMARLDLTDDVRQVLARTLRVEIGMMARRAMVAVVNRALQDARLEHRARLVPAADATFDDMMIDIVAVEGGSVVGIQLKDGRFGVNVYDLD